MGRLFKEHEKRQVSSLGGLWRFIEDAEKRESKKNGSKISLKQIRKYLFLPVGIVP